MPCSLSFDVDVLSENHLLSVSLLGVQSKCLHTLIMMGHDILVDPDEFISSCCKAWLIPSEEASKLDSIESKRKAILSLALKYDHLPTLIKLIERWASGEWTKIGCDCRFILNWIWEKVGRMKTSIDELTHCLFDGSNKKLSEPDYILLSRYVSVLKSLEILVHKLAQNGTLSTEQGLLELDRRREAIELIIMYLKVILWLHDCGLIPENFDDFEDIDHEENVSTVRGIYPRTHLSKAYRDLRCQLHTLNPVSSGLTDSLLIDGITNHFKDSLKSSRPCEEGGDEPFYPPPYIHSIVCIYLIDSIPLDVKHMIMQYFLLDLCSCHDIKVSGIAEKIKLFPVFFGLRSNLMQLIEGFWSIDNKQFDSGIKALSSPQVRNIMQSSHMLDETMKSLMDDLQRRLATSLLYRNKPRLALEIICQLGLFDINSAEKERLYTSILLRNGQLMKAFSFQRSRRTPENTEKTLLNFFICCENMNLMSKLFQFPLDKIEEDGLMYYLSHVSTSKNSKHFLLLFLLLNGKIIEAYQFREAFHEELLADKEGRPNPTGIHISAIIDAFFANLPEALVEIANDVHRHKSTEILERMPSAKVQAQKGAIDITAPSISPVVNISVDTVLKIVEEIEETTKDVDVENCSHLLGTPFQQKMERNGLLLTRDSPFLRSPFKKNDPKANKIDEDSSMLDQSRTQEGSLSIAKSIHFSQFETTGQLVTPAKSSLKPRSWVPLKSADISRVLATPPIKVQLGKNTSLRKVSLTPVSILKSRHNQPAHSSHLTEKLDPPQEPISRRSASPSSETSRRMIRFDTSDPVEHSETSEMDDRESLDSTGQFSFSAPNANPAINQGLEDITKRRGGKKMREVNESEPRHSMQLRLRH
ncbi:protein ELYS-like [Brevipalpus obovatus]|uniref:protein ELYS-like n=1 Tax=Brevipalpus obovatus TaxID=246614 RepID=UPI003D9F85B6